MKRMPFTTNFWIKPNRSYPTNELFELMKEKLGDKFGPFELKTEKTFTTTVGWICTHGTDNYVIQIQPVDLMGGRIIISQDKPLKQVLKDNIIWIVFGVITLGIGFCIWGVVNRIRGWCGLKGTKANRDRMIALGEEIEKLVSK